MSGRRTPFGSTLEQRLALLSEPNERGCRIWQGGKDRDGYGWIRVNGFDRRVHRVAYERWVGPIPSGMQVDHLCFTPPCINPDHLRLLTLLENARNQRRALKTHCVHGHEFTPDNTVLQVNQRNPEGPRHRACRECRRISDRRRRAGRAAA